MIFQYVLFVFSDCADKMDNCLAFGKDSCGGKYEAFARENCARYCGYCQGMTFKFFLLHQKLS